MLKSGQKMVTAKMEPAQEETQTQQNTHLGAASQPPDGVLDSFGFLLGPAPFWR